MPKALWKGAISFGLLNVPVALTTAEARNDLSFNLVDDRDMARIRYERVNERSGKPVDAEHIVKAHTLADGSLVTVTEDDFHRAAPEADQTVAIQAFVRVAEIPAMYFEKPYYLEPDARGDKGYALLREALRQTGMAGLGLVVMHGRQHLCLVLPQGRALMLIMLRFAAELRGTDGLHLPQEDLAALKVQPKEVEMAQALISAMAAPWDPAQYRDEYRDKLLDFIAAKSAAGDTTAPPAAAETPAEPGKVLDLMELLKKSLEAAGKGAAGKPAPSGPTQTATAPTASAGKEAKAPKGKGAKKGVSPLASATPKKAAQG